MELGMIQPRAVAMDIVCVSHLRWDFVFQRPQHLLTRAARQGRVLYLEEPKLSDGPPSLEGRRVDGGVHVIVPVLPHRAPAAERVSLQASMLHRYLLEHGISEYALWYYTPMALKFTYHLNPIATIYDCMDELSAFAGAPPELAALERELFARADVVFTGGQTLFEAKRSSHHNVHAFPSSVDVAHFARARSVAADPMDQRGVGRPRLGYFGVIDERMDYELLRGVAAARPEWQIVLIGPTAKVDPASLPVAPNLHYLGPKLYADLPEYIAGWDVAILPFARNEATRFISPTKTPEYLAAGKPVVSTSIRDVVRPYGELRLARIADTTDTFVEAVEAALAENADERRRAADTLLATLSWDRTWSGMRRLVEQVAERRMTGV
jgi:glycosyltransferase involved in cell wall biosynthesis